ncbi:hypothetical protein AAMO2058_000145200 [Amorphochlora amoebiformis]
MSARLVVVFHDMVARTGGNQGFENFFRGVMEFESSKSTKVVSIYPEPRRISALHGARVRAWYNFDDCRRPSDLGKHALKDLKESVDQAKTKIDEYLKLVNKKYPHANVSLLGFGQGALVALIAGLTFGDGSNTEFIANITCVSIGEFNRKSLIEFHGDTENPVPFLAHRANRLSFIQLVEYGASIRPQLLKLKDWLDGKMRKEHVNLIKLNRGEAKLSDPYDENALFRKKRSRKKKTESKLSVVWETRAALQTTSSSNKY